MACNFPWTVRNKKGELVTVPCGRCRQCRIDRREQWIDRIMFEQSTMHHDGVFLTLTYNDVFYPGQLVKSDLQKFFKRLRKNLDGRKIKYYAVGEYGEIGGEHNYYGNELGRAHFHAIILGVNPLTDYKYIRASWNLGFIKVAPSNHATIRYVLKYMDKQLSQTEWKDLHGDIPAPFSTMSNGIGRQYLIDNQEQLSEQNGYYKNSVLRPLPKYYRQFLAPQSVAETDSAKRRKILDVMDKFGFTYEQAQNYLGQTNEYELISRDRLYGDDTSK